MSALYVCLLRRHHAIKMYVSMSVSVQCLCADVDGNMTYQRFGVYVNVSKFMCAAVVISSANKDCKVMLSVNIVLLHP